MKVKVIMPFKDKETGKIRNVGSEFEVTPKRFKEVKKYVEEVKEEAKPKAEQK